MLDLFFKTKGHIDQKQFLIGFLGLLILGALGNVCLAWLFDVTGNGLLYFFAAPIFWILIIYVLFCVYGKRLTDMGRKRRLVFWMIAVEALVMLAIMLAFGGAEYFSEYSQYPRKSEIDPQIKLDIDTRYQAEISKNSSKTDYLMLVIPILFTLWLAVTPSKSTPDNM